MNLLRLQGGGGGRQVGQSGGPGGGWEDRAAVGGMGGGGGGGERALPPAPAPVIFDLQEQDGNLYKSPPKVNAATSGGGYGGGASYTELGSSYTHQLLQQRGQQVRFFALHTRTLPRHTLARSPFLDTLA